MSQSRKLKIFSMKENSPQLSLLKELTNEQNETLFFEIKKNCVLLYIYRQKYAIFQKKPPISKIFKKVNFTIFFF